MQSNNKGFTLVEAMIAVFILTVMMLASSRGLIDIKNRGVEDVIRQGAVKLGQDLVTDIRNVTYTAVPAGVLAPYTLVRNTGGFDTVYTVNRVVVDNVVLNTVKSVAFTITWTSASNSNTKTYIARTLVART